MVVSPDHIKSAQEALKARGHNPGSVNGRMDEKTQQALRDFQKANNLPATGVLDEKTAEQLGVTLTEEGHSIPQGGPDNTMPRSNSVNPRGALQ
jgi:peptidoglycan hydrolase-like protein with peptidoglycan-binding domain